MTNTILRFTPDGAPSVFADRVGSRYGLAIDDEDNVYVTGSGSSIEKFSPAGEPSFFAPVGNIPLYLEFRVPEPSTWLAVMLGLPLLMSRRKHRRTA